MLHSHAWRGVDFNQRALKLIVKNQIVTEHCGRELYGQYNKILKITRAIQFKGNLWKGNLLKGNLLKGNLLKGNLLNLEIYRAIAIGYSPFSIVYS